ncbi:hypothetical protein BOC58_09370 [Burkholderia pseudomallei]|nr:hypothetical protein BOC58_09370 [Burkholderia pseudomallei]
MPCATADLQYVGVSLDVFGKPIIVALLLMCGGASTPLVRVNLSQFVEFPKLSAPAIDRFVSSRLLKLDTV